MAYVYLYIGSHGCWSNDGTRYISKGEYADKLEDFPAGMSHRFAVVETDKKPVAKTEQEPPPLPEPEAEVSED